MRNSRTRLLDTPAKQTRSLASESRQEPILFFARRFISNTAWIMDLLSLLDKLARGQGDLNHFERLIAEDYLQMTLVPTLQGLKIHDRAGVYLELEDLLALRERILVLCDTYARSLLKQPKKHPVSKGFRQVLAKAGYKQLNEEEVALLREAYLSVRNGQLVTLQGLAVSQPTLAARLLWRLSG